MSLVLIISVTVCAGALGWAIGLGVQLHQRSFWLLSGLLLSLLVMQATVLSASLGISPAANPGSWPSTFAHMAGSILALLLVGNSARQSRAGDLPAAGEKTARDQLRFTQFSVDSCSSAIFWIREDASFFYVNDSATRRFGYTRDELLRMTVHDLDPAYPATVWPEYWQLMQAKRSVTFETRMQHKDGTEIPVELTTNLLDLEGREFVFAFANDITHRRMTEAALRESEDRFKTIFQNAPDAAFLIEFEGDESGTILMANETAEQMHGYLPGELVGKKITQLVAPDDAIRAPERLDQLAAGRTPGFEVEHRRRDGTTFPVEVKASRIMIDGRVCVVAFDRDITRRREMEMALRESGANLSALIENSMDNILSVDRNFRVLTVNSVVRENARYFGGLEIEPGDDLLKKLSPRLVRLWKRRAQRALEGEPFTLEEQFQFNGQTFVYDVSFNPIVNHGQITGVSVFARDITGRRRAEQALRKSEARVRLAFDQQFQFMAILSSDGKVLEINNLPLRVLGASRQEYIGKYYWETPAWKDCPDWQSVIRSQIEQARTMNGPLLTEDRYQTVNGTIRFADSAYTAIRDEHHDVQLILVQATDTTERKRALDALRESEERWQFALEGSRDGVWDWNAETNEVFFSKRWKAMLGYEDTDVSCQLGEWEKRVHPDDRTKCYSDLQKHLDGITPFYENEHRVLCKDGSWKWVLDRGKVITRTDQGQPRRIIGTHTDIGERKLAEKALRQSEQLFRSLVETAPFGIQRCDIHGRITFANPALGQIFGCSPQQLIGRHVWDFLTDDRLRRVTQRTLRRSPADPDVRPQAFEAKNRTCDNRIIDVYVDWTHERNAEGQVVGFMAIVTDVTRNRESERALEFQADILNQVSDAVLVTDMSGAATYANAAAKQLGQFAGQLHSGKQLADFHDRNLIAGLTSQAIQESLKRTGSWQGESEIQTGTAKRWFELKLKAFEYPDRDEPYVLSVIRDISPRKLADQELREHRQMLAHVTRLNTMGEMVAGIAHELKQPLHAVANFATATSVTLAKTRPDTWDEQQLKALREWNEGIRVASQHASEIIRRLREFARKGEQKRESVNLNRVIQDSIDLVAFEARQCHANVDTSLDADLPSVDADRIQCEQVVVNLLHNAYEALTQTDLPRQVVVRSRQREDFVEIEVEDNGPGFQPGQQGRLFEAFYTTKPEGMGLGLAISQTIVEDHGGRLWATGNRHRGTTFRFTLPLQHESLVAPGDSRQ